MEKWTTLRSLKKNGNTIMTKKLDECYMCKGQAEEVHHVMHGPDKKLSEKYGLLVPICRECHYQIHHGNGLDDRLLKEDAQREVLIQIFGRCYL